MKKIFAILLSLAVCLMAAARTISSGEALKYASRFFDDAPESDFNLVWTGSETSVPSFYAFNKKNGGFIIISSENATVPVIGYSYSGAFSSNNMPENLKGWFNGLEKDLVMVRNDKLAQGSEVKSKWETIGIRTKGGEETFLLKTAEWDQGNPYNYYCNISHGRKAVTGCVATAMAIFLHHLGYPAHGTGYLNGYKTASEGYQIDGYSIDDHNYDWKSMPLSDEEVQKADEDVQKQIAQIMHDCGVAVKMDYTTNSSGASSLRIPEALSSHFGFSDSVAEYSRDLYDYPTWEAMLKNELKQDRPVMYGGQDEGGAGGHQFIIDGFDGKGLWHVNWGWSGSNNGYYAINLSIPDEYAFSVLATAILGTVPDPDKTKGEKISQIVLENTGIKLISGEFASGKEFEINPNYIANLGPADYKGKAVPALVAKDGTVLEKISEPQDLEISGTTGNFYYTESSLRFTCRTNKALNFGDGVMMMYLVPGTENEYALIPYTHNGTRGKLTAIPMFIKMNKQKYSEGDIFECDIEGGSEPVSSTEWYYDGKKVIGRIIQLTKGTHEIKAVVVCGDKTYNIFQEISVN